MEDAGENAKKPHSNPPLVMMRRSRQPSVPRLRCQPTRPPLEHETLSSRQAITSHGCSRNNDELAERLIEPFAGTTKYENEGAFLDGSAYIGVMAGRGTRDRDLIGRAATGGPRPSNEQFGRHVA